MEAPTLQRLWLHSRTSCRRCKEEQSNIGTLEHDVESEKNNSDNLIVTRWEPGRWRECKWWRRGGSRCGRRPPPWRTSRPSPPSLCWFLTQLPPPPPCLPKPPPSSRSPFKASSLLAVSFSPLLECYRKVLSASFSPLVLCNRKVQCSGFMW